MNFIELPLGIPSVGAAPIKRNLIGSILIALNQKADFAVADKVFLYPFYYLFNDLQSVATKL